MRYYIYHIPGVKIGCTTNVPHRMREQGFTEWEVLEVHTDIYEVSNREIELQKQYGYRVDKTPYWMSVQNRSVQSQINVKTCHIYTIATKESRALGGRNSGPAKSKLNQEQRQEIRDKYISKSYTQNMLANEYNVSRRLIRIVLEKNEQ